MRFLSDQIPILLGVLDTVRQSGANQTYSQGHCFNVSTGKGWNSNRSYCNDSNVTVMTVMLL